MVTNVFSRRILPVKHLLQHFGAGLQHKLSGKQAVAEAISGFFDPLGYSVFLISRKKRNITHLRQVQLHRVGLMSVHLLFLNLSVYLSSNKREGKSPALDRWFGRVTSPS